MPTVNETMHAGAYGAGRALHTEIPFRHQITNETMHSGLKAGGGAYYRPTRFPLTNQLWDGAATGTVVEVTKTSCEVLSVYAFHVNAVDLFLVLYDRWKDEIGSGTAFSYVALLPAGTGTLAGGFAVEFQVPIHFANGLCYRISTSPTSVGAMGGNSAAQLNLTWR
jgi:hypothetical protein